MRNLTITAILGGALLLQGAVVLQKPVRPGDDALASEVSLLAAKPHEVSGMPVLLASGAAAEQAYQPVGPVVFRPAGAASLVSSPFFGAGSIVFSGSRD